uniref:Uncharacterized protein n=1 Tax=Rhizophora mucronata TaxID=61149 RepID=A0A2P2R567_RHIMU
MSRPWVLIVMLLGCPQFHPIPHARCMLHSHVVVIP